MGQDAPTVKGHIPLLQGGHIAAEGQVSGPEPDSLGGGLQRRTAGIAYPGIAAEDGEDGRIAPGGEFLRAVPHTAQHAAGAEPVHHRRIYRFQRGLAPQHRGGIVRHPIPDHQNITHV